MFVLLPRRRGESIRRRPKAAEGDRVGVEDADRTARMVSPFTTVFTLEVEEPMVPKITCLDNCQTDQNGTQGVADREQGSSLLVE
jgi:hypothetical protein